MSVAARFVHIGFRCDGPVPIEALEALFASAKDWLRYDPHCWILYTTTELRIWRDRIRNLPEIKAGDNFFLCEFDAYPGSGYAGWMKSTIWDWLNKKR